MPGLMIIAPGPVPESPRYALIRCRPEHIEVARYMFLRDAEFFACLLCDGAVQRIHSLMPEGEFAEMVKRAAPRHKDEDRAIVYALCPDCEGAGVLIEQVCEQVLLELEDEANSMETLRSWVLRRSE
jgi:hypothetical protein